MCQLAQMSKIRQCAFLEPRSLTPVLHPGKQRHAIRDTGTAAKRNMCANWHTCWMRFTFGPHASRLSTCLLAASLHSAARDTHNKRQMLITDPATIEAASWRLVAALCARAPGRLTVIETHPGGGLYDCLSLYASDGRQPCHLADINRLGAFHALCRLDGNPVCRAKRIELWTVGNEADNWVSVTEQIADTLGLAVSRPSQEHSALQPSNRDVSYRFMAQFLTNALHSHTSGRWEARNGFCDSAGYGGGVSDEFTLFPSAIARLHICLPSDLGSQPAYRYWFLLRDEHAQVCLETSTALTWQRDGEVGVPPIAN